jgi:hypothetical protein
MAGFGFRHSLILRHSCFVIVPISAGSERWAATAAQLSDVALPKEAVASPRANRNLHRPGAQDGGAVPK